MFLFAKNARAKLEQTLEKLLKEKSNAENANQRHSGP